LHKELLPKCTDIGKCGDKGALINHKAWGQKKLVKTQWNERISTADVGRADIEASSATCVILGKVSARTQHIILSCHTPSPPPKGCTATRDNLEESLLFTSSMKAKDFLPVHLFLL